MLGEHRQGPHIYKLWSDREGEFNSKQWPHKSVKLSHSAANYLTGDKLKFICFEKIFCDLKCVADWVTYITT